MNLSSHLLDISTVLSVGRSVGRSRALLVDRLVVRFLEVQEFLFSLLSSDGVDEDLVMLDDVVVYLLSMHARLELNPVCGSGMIRPTRGSTSASRNLCPINIMMIIVILLIRLLFSGMYSTES